jgi:hypothetical protein
MHGGAFWQRPSSDCLHHRILRRDVSTSGVRHTRDVTSARHPASMTTQRADSTGR